MLTKITDPLKVVTDLCVISHLNSWDIDPAYVEFTEDYTGSHPYNKFYRNHPNKSNIMVSQGLPMCRKTDGQKIIPEFALVGGKHIPKTNLFDGEIDGNRIYMTLLNDQPDGRKAGEGVCWEPELFIGGVKQSPSSPVLLETDPTNPDLHYNVIEWDYGVCQRWVRVIQGRLKEMWNFPQQPHGEIRIKHNNSGDFAPKIGWGVDSLRLPLPVHVENGDEEVFSAFDIVEGYPIRLMATLTVNPDAHPETTSVDGRAYRLFAANGGESWANITGNAGTAANDAESTIDFTYMRTQTGSDWRGVMRGFFLFDTSALTAGATISAATESLYGANKVDLLGVTPDLNIYASNPNTNIALIAADYQAVGTTPYCDTPITYAGFNTAGYNDFLFNATGRAAISKTGITKTSSRNANYDVSGTPPGTGNDLTSELIGYCSDNGSNEPKLVIDYNFHITEPVSVLVEVGASITATWDAISPVLALVEVEAAITEDTWAYRKSLIVNAAAVDAPLSDFPCAVVLTSTNFDFTKARSDGYDIRFMASDGQTFLKYERVSHDNGAKLAEYHFKASSLTDSSIFYMLYGNADAADGADPEPVWDDDFVMVQHMDDTTTSTITDSTQYDNDGTKKAANEPIEAAGKVGEAQDFDGADDYIEVAHHSNQLLTTGGSIEAWIKAESFGEVQGKIVDKSTGVTGGNGYSLCVVNGGYIRLYMHGSARQSAFGAIIFGDGNFSHVVVTWNNTGYTTFYVNGLQSGTPGITADPAVITTTNALRIGNRSGVTDRTFDGLIDEVRISDVPRSAAWIKAEYNSGNDTLFTISDGDITETVSGLVEVEAAIPSSIKSPLSALVEVEATIPSTIASPVSALVEVEASILSGIKSPLSALIEVEAAIPSTINHPVAVLIEIGVSATGAVTSKWLLIPDYLHWQGVWVATTAYDRDDVVLYESGDLIHAFVSKTDHNTGNIPNLTYQHWTRLVQEEWNR